MEVDWNSKLMEVKSLKSVEEALNNGADVNTEDQSTATPLFKALLYCRSLDIARLLVSRGANVNKIYRADWAKGNTVLAMCVKYGYNEYAKYLVSVGANVCKVGKEGRTPLSWAVHNESIEMIKLLLDHGAHFTIPTAFVEAIKLNNLEIVNILISKGADVNALYTNGCTPLTKAIELGDIKIVKILISNGADVNFIDKDGYTPLTKALEVANTEIVKELIENGADVNTPDPVNGDHPLIKSIKSGRFEIARLIIEKGANPSTPNSFALIRGTELGNFELVKALIEKGASLKVTDKLGRSPFLIALEEDHFELVKYFVEQGEDVHQVFHNEETTLSIAAANLNYQMFKFLVDLGADINLASDKIEKIASENDNFHLFLKTMRGKDKMNKTKFLGSNGQDSAV